MGANYTIDEWNRLAAAPPSIWARIFCCATADVSPTVIMGMIKDYPEGKLSKPPSLSSTK
jgi:hypothetical protein